MRGVRNTAMKVLKVIIFSSICLAVRAQDIDTLFVNTTEHALRMEADKFLPGYIIFSDNDTLKTSNGTHTLLLEPSNLGGLGQGEEFVKIRGISQSGNLVFVVESDRHCVRSFNRVTNEVQPLIGQCGEAGNSNGGEGVNRLWYPFACLYDEREEILLIADSGNRVVRSYNLHTKVVETYLKFEEDSATILSMTQNLTTKDIYIYTWAAPSKCKVYKIHRSELHGQTVKVVEQVLSYTRPAELVSRDLIPVNGGLVAAVMEEGETRIRVLHHGETQTGCNITLDSLGGVSLLTVGTDLFIGRKGSITRVADISRKLSCATFVDTNAPSNAQIFSEDIGVPANKNVMHIAADKTIPGNLIFSDFAGLHSFNPIANLTGHISTDTIYTLGRTPLNNSNPVITGFEQMDSQRIVITASDSWNQIRLVGRDGTDAVDLVAASNGSDVDGDINSSGLNKPLVIIGDHKEPGRYLFSDQDNGKIKSLNVSSKTVQTEYTGRGVITALAQHPVSGDFYFADRSSTNQWPQKLQRIPYSLSSTSVELIDSINPSGDLSGSILFNDLIFLDGATKLMLLIQKTYTEIIELKLYDLSTHIPNEIKCNFDIAGVSFYQEAPLSVAGVFLSSDDTLYIGNTNTNTNRGISKIQNFTNLLRTYCPTF